MVRHDGVGLGQPDGLDADSGHDLLVAVAVQELPADDGGLDAPIGACGAELLEYDCCAEEDGDEGRDGEGEEDLGGTVSGRF